MSDMGQTRRLSCPGMSASPPTSDVSLRASEPTLRANFKLMHCTIEGVYLIASLTRLGSVGSTVTP